MRFDLVGALKGMADRGVSSRHVTRGARRGVVLQLALSVALFVSAMLLLRSYQHLLVLDLGYPAASIAAIDPMFSGKLYEDIPTRMEFAERVTTDARTLPGIGATAVRGYFMGLRQPTVKNDPSVRTSFRLVPDRDSSRAPAGPTFYSAYAVSDRYFDLLGLKLRIGRSFAAVDGSGSQPVAVLGAHTAQLVWGAMSPVGHTIQLGTHGEPLLVIGVVDDVRELRGGARGMNADPAIAIYVSTRQALSYNPELLARGTGRVLDVRERVLQLVRQRDPSLLVLNAQTTMASSVDQNFLVMRVFGGVIGVFATAALVLAVIGIYGVVGFGIAQRRREIGIRVALGGTAAQVTGMITRETLRFVGIGLASGIVLSLALSRIMKILLFNVSPVDPIVYSSVIVLFGGVALAASYLPARRAGRVDPLIALRAD